MEPLMDHVVPTGRGGSLGGPSGGDRRRLLAHTSWMDGWMDGRTGGCGLRAAKLDPKQEEALAVVPSGFRFGFNPQLLIQLRHNPDFS